MAQLAHIATTTQQIDRALAYVAARVDLISRAHEELGIPLADCLSAAVRQALSITAAQAIGHVSLFRENHEQETA